MIDFAISQRQTLRIQYKDDSDRWVNPYVLGETTTGKVMLSAFQTNGASASGEDRGWKLFNVEEIRDMSLIYEWFEVREDYNAEDKVFKKVLNRIPARLVEVVGWGE